MLAIQVGRAAPIEMQPIGDDTFAAGDYGVQFVSTSANRATALLLSTELTRQLRFTRR